jgi:hypothetical protein
MNKEVEQIDKLKKKPIKGGVRPGSGRPKGSMNDETRERMEALKQFKNRVAVNVDKLFNSQLSIAVGRQYLYRIDEIEKTNAAGKKYTVKEHVLVTDPDEIQKALDDELRNGEDYYYITTKDPDNKAIDSLLDRTYGKPEQAVKHSGDEENPIRLVLD